MITPANSAFSVEPYTAALKELWDTFVQTSKNGTFMLMRDYMEYHSHRFQDCSLILRHEGDVAALFPANRLGDEVHSHQGLTYGGLVTGDTMTTPLMLDLFGHLLAHLRDDGMRRLHYKTIPSIYHRLPAEEDRYALFRAGATLSRRDVLSVIPSGRRGPIQARRRRGMARAAKHGVVVTEAADWTPWWDLLNERLQARYGVAPVHSLAELEQLRSRFPKHISLFQATLASEVLAGVVMFESPMTAHAQYIAASEAGLQTGALDAVFRHMIDDVFSAKPYFDFGISNEQQGRVLNCGLIEQKEGFGARAVVHDYYTLDL